MPTACHSGEGSKIDTTVVSALTGRGVARGRRQGEAIHEAEQDKDRTHPELLTGTRCHFLVMAFEVARWSPSAVPFTWAIWFHAREGVGFCEARVFFFFF